MKKTLSLLLFMFLCIEFSAQELSLYDINNGKYAQKGVAPVNSSPDGEFYYQANTARTQIIKYEYKSGEPVGVIFDTKTARESTIESFEGFIVSPDEKRILVYNDSEQIYRHSFKAVLYNYDIRRNMIRKLTNNSSKQSVPKFSRDGRMLAYVADNDIWLVKFDFDTESQITKDGSYNHIINGATDWVYEEEFGTTSIMDFSAENNLLAFIKFDESRVRQYTMQLFKNKLYTDFFRFKYPKAGESNSIVQCMVFDIDAKTIKEIKLPQQVEYIPRIEFFPSGDNLAVMTLNREQNHFEMYSANAKSLVPRSILQEKNERYIDSQLFSGIHFFGNKFTYLTEQDGYTHIYLYNENGVKEKQVTQGNFDVTKLLAVDPIKNIVFYQAAATSPLQREIYKTDLLKGVTVKLSEDDGTNNAIFSNNGKYFFNIHNSATSPNLVTMHDGFSGKRLRVIENNEKLISSLNSVKIPVKEFITFKAANGQILNGYIIKPINFNSSKKYPVIMSQYSGPNSQTVLDRFGIDWEHYAASLGYIVVSVDGRGTGARGEDFRKCTYLNLGIYESDDQVAVAKQLANLPYVDSSKLGIWGWSYGGYNVLMSMSRGNGVFKAGVAIAPVTDWKFYDTVYGERFMRTPQQNALGYANGSAIKLANQLQGNLLVIHGSADDNVHYQNTMEYTNALIDAGKQFDMFTMPDRDHSMIGAKNRTYIYNKVVRYFNQNM